MKPRLIISIDQVALLRFSRKTREPDPVHFALQAEIAGAMGLRAHLRIDQKHLTEDDAALLNRLAKTEFYLQVSPHQDVVHLVNSLRPHNLILAAERRDDKASDSSIDAVLLANELKGLIHNLDARQTKTYLFIDPVLDQIKMAAKLQVHGVLLNTRELMVNPLGPLPEKKRDQFSDALRLSVKYGLVTHLAGGILVERLPELSRMAGVAAIHSGHQLVARSLLTGVERAVKDYLERMDGAEKSTKKVWV